MSLAYAVAEAVREALLAEVRERFDDLSEDTKELIRSEVAGEGLGGELTEAEAWVSCWNNEPGRTHGEVLAMVDSAIARQRERIAGRD